MLNLGKKVILYSSRKYAYFQINCRVFAELGLKIMSKVAIVTAALILSIVSTSSFAANAEKKLKAKIAPVASVTEVTKSPNVTVRHNWTGPYVGLNVGYAFNGSGFSSGNTIYSTMSGITGGGLIGYNFQYNNYVVGILADGAVSSASLNGSGSSAPVYSSPTNASVRLKAGYLLDNETLFYLTGGYKGQRSKVDLTTYSVSDTEWIYGYVVGVGLERFITPSISLDATYLYSNYNSTTYNYLINGSNVSSTGTGSGSEFRIGLNFHF